MRGHELKTTAENGSHLLRQALERQAEKPEARGTGSLQRDPLEQVTCRIGDASCAQRHIAVLEHAPVFHPANPGQKVRTILQLQQTYGNAFVQRVIQAKLTIGQSGDQYEQEAGRVPGGERKTTDLTRFAPSKRTSSILKTGYQFEQDLIHKIRQRKKTGKRLEPSTRLEMETVFGQDFGNIAVHTDSQVSDIAKYLRVPAFTVGSDIFFVLRNYDPSSKAGKRLIAHELTHVVQQRRGTNVNARRDSYEMEAERNADLIGRHSGMALASVLGNRNPGALAIQFASYLGRFLIFPALYLDPEVVSDIVDVMNAGAGASGIAAVLSAAGIITAKLAIPTGILAGVLVIGASVLNIMSRHGNGIVIVLTGLTPPAGPVLVLPRSLVE